MVGNSVRTSVLTYLVIFFSLLLVIKGVTHQILHLFNKIDKSRCLWQPCILNHSCFHPDSPRKGYFYYPDRKARSSARVMKLTLCWSETSDPECVQLGPYPFEDNRMFLNFSIAGETPRFFHAALQFLENVLEVRCWTKLQIFVFSLKCIPYRLWHKCRVHHFAFPRTVIHEETPFTGCQPIRSSALHGSRARPQSGLGLRRNAACSPAWHSARFAIARQGGPAHAEKESRRL